MVLGVVAELDFMKDTLQKVGMAADFIHVGKYKSAPERMTRSSASAENREMIAAIVEDRYAALVEMLAPAARGRASRAAWIDSGSSTRGRGGRGPRRHRAYRDAMVDGRFPDDEVSDFGDYAAGAPPRAHDAPVVAFIQAAGVIMSGESGEEPLQGRSLGSDTARRAAPRRRRRTRTSRRSSCGSTAPAAASRRAT